MSFTVAASASGSFRIPRLRTHCERRRGRGRLAGLPFDGDPPPGFACDVGLTRQWKRRNDVRVGCDRRCSKVSALYRCGVQGQPTLKMCLGRLSDIVAVQRAKIQKIAKTCDLREGS